MGLPRQHGPGHRRSYITPGDELAGWMGALQASRSGSDRRRVHPAAFERARSGLCRDAGGGLGQRELRQAPGQPADERHLFLFARGYKEGGNYFYRLSDSYEDGTAEHVDDLLLPQGISDVWFRGRARREGGDLLGTTEVWLARFQAQSGWHRYVVRIEEQHLPSPNLGTADDPVPEGWRRPKERNV